MNRAQVAIVGGGPAGAALAIRLARTGLETVVFERLPRPRWRAAGVYTSPLTRLHLLALGLAPSEVDGLIRPISAMVIKTADGAALCRLRYAGPHAGGVDRVRLEGTLLAHARRAGAQVQEGGPVIALELGHKRPRLTVSGPAGFEEWQVGIVVGADGPASIVARTAGLALPSRRFRRSALTVHRADPAAAPAGVPMEAELVVGQGWYCGIAPVPGGRVNLGLVLGEAALRDEVAGAHGLAGVLARRLEQLPGAPRGWASAPATDELQVCLPLTHRVRRPGGDNFLLIGDASGFIDPLSGEGLQRAFASAWLAAGAIDGWSRGRAGALAAYERRLRARFGSKDVLSWLLQGFLTDQRLAAYALRNLARREPLGTTFALVLADLLPSSRVLDPRFLLRLLRP